MTTPPPPAGDEPVLATPPGLVLPAASAARLRRQYDRRPPGVAGIVAPIAEVPAGSSVTVAAEWAAMAPIDAWEPAADRSVAGVALLDPAVAHVVDATGIAIEATGATLLVDPGAPAFAPATASRQPESPGREARPPFRWRPVVVLLASSPAPERAPTLAALADALVGHEVEARLALLDPIDDPVLTRPCPADAATIGALRPDVILAVDLGAIELAEQWSAARRATVVVHVDPDLGDRIELVPWTIGIARGRLRARVGDHVEPGALAHLVNRLCSGPLAGPPTDTDDASSIDATPVAIGAPPIATRSLATRRIEIVAGPDGPSPLLAGLADHLAGAGHHVDTTAPTTDPPPDVRLTDAAADAGASVVVERAGGDAVAITASAAVAAQRRRDGTSTLVVPVLRTRAAVATVTRAVDHRVRPAVPAIGWLADPAPAEAPAPHAAALIDALDSIAAERGDLQVILVDPPVWLLDAVADRPWATRRGALPDPDELVGWSAAVWSAPSDPSGASPPPSAVLVDLGLAAVPVVVAAPDAIDIGALIDPVLVVDPPDAPASWAAALAPLLHEGRRTAFADRAQRVATALHGHAAAALVVDRFLGWADTGRTP